MREWNCADDTNGLGVFSGGWSSMVCNRVDLETIIHSVTHIVNLIVSVQGINAFAPDRRGNPPVFTTQHLAKN